MKIFFIKRNTYRIVMKVREGFAHGFPPETPKKHCWGASLERVTNSNGKLKAIDWEAVLELVKKRRVSYYGLLEHKEVPQRCLWDRKCKQDPEFRARYNYIMKEINHETRTRVGSIRHNK